MEEEVTQPTQAEETTPTVEEPVSPVIGTVVYTNNEGGHETGEVIAVRTYETSDKRVLRKTLLVDTGVEVNDDPDDHTTAVIEVSTDLIIDSQIPDEKAYDNIKE